MKMMISDISEERWEEMSARDRFEALREALSDYLDRRIDGARYEDGTGYEAEMVILCENAMFCDLVTLANYRWWNANGKSYGVTVYGRLCPVVCFDILDTDVMTYEDAEDIEDICNRLLDYPIIDDDTYYELENDAFEEAFREEYYEAGELAPEWQDIGEDRLRELAWESGGVNGDYYYINTSYVERNAEKIRSAV